MTLRLTKRQNCMDFFKFLKAIYGQRTKNFNSIGKATYLEASLSKSDNFAARTTRNLYPSKQQQPFNKRLTSIRNTPTQNVPKVD